DRREYLQQHGGGTISWQEAISWPERPYPRVAKGGFWDSEAEDLKISSRILSDDEEWKASDPNLPRSPWWYTEYPASGVGFRIVRPLHRMSPKLKNKVWELDSKEIAND